MAIEFNDSTERWLPILRLLPAQQGNRLSSPTARLNQVRNWRRSSRSHPQDARLRSPPNKLTQSHLEAKRRLLRRLDADSARVAERLVKCYRTDPLLIPTVGWDRIGALAQPRPQNCPRKKTFSPFRFPLIPPGAIDRLLPGDLT